MSYFVHPLGLCESSNVGDGTRIWAWAHVMSQAVVGRDCKIGDHAYVEGVIGDRVTIKNNVMVWEGVTIEDDVFVGPGVVFTNDLMPSVGGPWTLTPTLVRAGTTIGANATIVCGVTLGEHSFVGAGAVVTHDVAPHTLVVGNPARPLRQMPVLAPVTSRRGDDVWSLVPPEE